MINLISMLLIVAANLFDFATTEYGLAHALYEMNPLIRFFGAFPMKLAAAIVGIIGVQYLGGRDGLLLAIVLTVINVAAGLWNLYQINHLP